MSNKRSRTKSHKLWSSRLPSETLFWERWLETGGLNWPGDFQWRTSPTTQLQPELAALIDSPNARIIDVGAGPLTSVGKEWKGQKLDLTAVDALAEEFSSLLSKHHVVAPVRTLKAEAEALADSFSENTFDLAIARNCLDHSYDPILAIRQMLHITKASGIVYLKHFVNEGARESYRGLHQWNFVEQGGEFVISGPAQAPVNVSQEMGGMADISVSSSGGWITVIMRKQ